MRGEQYVLTKQKQKTGKFGLTAENVHTTYVLKVA